ncbi:MAG: D-inositol-3-phosphate glycosyltransferase [Phycisphaerae bacterium]|nr:D-inositol-3-phosphate glycosyltransferase [Phycisphaerae bacterium]
MRSRGATRVACPAESSRNLLIRLGVPADRIDVLPNGVDTARFSPVSEDRRRALRAARGWARDRCIAVCVASLTPVKGHDVLIRAADALRGSRPSVEFVFIGDGPLRQRLETEVRNRGLAVAVSFLGNRDDVPDLLRAADLLVCPSRSESMCNAVLEGLASGLPVIAANVGDNRLLLDNGAAGVIVPPEDAAAIAGAIQAVVADEPQRRAFGRAARRRASAFSEEAMIARYDAYYRSLLNPAPVMLLKARTTEPRPSGSVLLTEHRPPGSVLPTEPRPSGSVLLITPRPPESRPTAQESDDLPAGVASTPHSASIL